MDNSRMNELVDHLQALDLEQTGLGVACKINAPRQVTVKLNELLKVPSLERGAGHCRSHNRYTNI